MKQQFLFTKDQIKRTANLLDNAGQVLLATVIIPPVITRSGNLSTIALGIFISFTAWWLSLRLERISS